MRSGEKERGSGEVGTGTGTEAEEVLSPEDTGSKSDWEHCEGSRGEMFVIVGGRVRCVLWSVDHG